jgi:chemotaxis protein methyltransferase CheR
MEERTITVEEMDNLLNTLYMHFGYDFRGYATSSLRRRVAHFMAANRIDSMSLLNQKTQESRAFSEELIRELSVTVTELFRDPSYYKALREKVIRRLATYPVIRIWVAGCATGEEAYSLAVMLKEEGLLERSIIYATDINPRSVETARRGIYPLSSMQQYTANYLAAGGTHSLSEYYLAKYDSVLLDRSLAERIVFSTHNLVSDTAFNEFQLIACRNVLIYFNQDLQNKVIGLFYGSLCSFGFLCLGNRESLLFSDKKEYFEEVSKRERIFIKSGNSNP